MGLPPNVFCSAVVLMKKGGKNLTVMEEFA